MLVNVIFWDGWATRVFEVVGFYRMKSALKNFKNFIN